MEVQPAGVCTHLKPHLDSIADNYFIGYCSSMEMQPAGVSSHLKPHLSSIENDLRHCRMSFHFV